MCQCQCVGVSCTHCCLIGWGKPLSPSSFMHLVKVEKGEGISFVEAAIDTVEDGKASGGTIHHPSNLDIDIVLDSISSGHP